MLHSIIDVQPQLGSCNLRKLLLEQLFNEFQILLNLRIDLQKYIAVVASLTNFYFRF